MFLIEICPEIHRVHGIILLKHIYNYTGQPDNSMKQPDDVDCIMIRITPDFEWNDVFCNETFATICQLISTSETCEYVFDKDKTCHLRGGSKSHSGCMLYFSA